MSLKEYNRKRDFQQTPEPAGKAKASRGTLQFVIQKHAASRLHYDFRLELDGTLKSWAVPKGPSLDPSVKALAVQVEDHPLDYASFEGIIPQGQYGGGAVMVWDRGTWEPEDVNPAAAYRNGGLKFTLYGEKLKGGWALVRMGGRAGDDGKNWLLIKHRDKYARSADEYDVTQKKAKSVLSKRTIEQIAKAADRVWSSNREREAKPPASAARSRGSTARQSDAKRARRAAAPKAGSAAATGRKNSAATGSAKIPAEQARAMKPPNRGAKEGVKAAAPTREEVAALPGAREGRHPRSLQPQLATLAAAAPAGKHWIHELKFDGYRMLADVRDGKARLITRNGNDWTARFRTMAEAVAALPIDSAILDGEVVSLDERGVSNFQRLQSQLKRGTTDQLAYYLFDLPYYQGYDLTGVPLIARKELLERLLASGGAGVSTILRYSDHIAGGGGDVWQQACRRRLEGIVCKRADSGYTQARSPAWLKVKCTKRQEFVVAGFTQPTGSRVAFGALLLGYHLKGKLVYAGKVGTGFTSQSLRDVHRELMARKVDRSAFDVPPRGSDARGVTWVRPELVAEVEFTEWTEDGRLRHPSFQGLREDKPPELIIREEAKIMPSNISAAKGRAARNGVAKLAPRGARARPRAATPAAEAVVQGVTISSPDKVMYPGFDVRKIDLARYYESIADWVMPYVERRPLTLVRCPEGQSSPCFYQKHISGTMPQSVHGVKIKEKDATDVYLAVKDIAGLVALVQMGVLEFHPWPAREDKVERPDMLIFDLDPGEGLDWNAVVQGARDVRACLAAVGLESFLRTSGGKGLHVVAPLARRNTWDELKEFARGVATTMERAAPDRYVVNMSKAKRKGKIFVDYLRNQRGATAVASYSTRARPGAAIATPIAWEELSTRLRADQFNVGNIHERLRRGFKDPWKEFFQIKQSITRAMLKSVSG